MANWNKPELDTKYQDVLDNLDDKDKDTARMFGDGTSSTNIPDKAVRLSVAEKTFKWWNKAKSKWEKLIDKFDINISGKADTAGIADKLKTKHKIAGHDFDGTQNVSIHIDDINGTGDVVKKDVNTGDGGDGNHVLTKGSYGVGAIETKDPDLDLWSDGFSARFRLAQPQKGFPRYSHILHFGLMDSSYRAQVGVHQHDIYIRGKDDGTAKKLISGFNLKQTTGSSKDYPMSQDAVTKEFDKLGSAAKKDINTGDGGDGSSVLTKGSYGVGKPIGATGDTMESQVRDGLRMLVRPVEPVPSDSPTGDHAVKWMDIGDSSWITQLAWGAYNETFYMRNRSSSNGSMRQWVEITHSGNLKTSTGNSTQYPMTQKAVTNMSIVWSGGEYSLSLGKGKNTVPSGYVLTGLQGADSRGGERFMSKAYARKLKLS